MCEYAVCVKPIISTNPLKSGRLRISGDASKVTNTYSVEQMKFLVEHIPDIQNPTDRTYLAIQVLHPMRLEEVLGLQWGDIDFENRIIHITRAATHPTRNQPEVKCLKTDSSMRPIGLSPLAIPYLSCGNRDDFVIGGKRLLSYTQVRNMCDRIKKDVGFTENITPIRFRTTVLTDIHNATRDIKLVQAAAGHTSAAMTLKYYVKGREDILDAAMAISKVYTD